MSARLVPTVTPDTQFFWEGLKEGRLLLQRCAQCGRLRHPPRPMCPWCNSLDKDAIESSGRGSVHSFVMPQHPPDPFIDGRYIVVLVDLEEGVRIVSNLRDVDPDVVTIGMAVELTFETFDGDVVLHQFRPAVPS
jgi:uncharacterized OB-fold protein